MKKISDAVVAILKESDSELDALAHGVLNMSAYAQRIKTRVENDCLKPVEIGSIVVALSRYARTMNTFDVMRVPVAIEHVTVKSPLCDLCFEKNASTTEKLAQFRSKVEIKDSEFCTITQGVNEITIILSSDRKEEVLAFFQMKTKACIDDVVAISVQFNEKYIEVPNTLYSLMYTLAAKRVNVLEIVSTYTELTFIVRKADMAKSVAVLGELLGKQS